MSLRVFEAFAGYGGASFGLRRAGIDFTCIGYSEVDKHAIDLYDGNHLGIRNFGDITEVIAKEIPDFDLFTGGFPCQPFSQVGLGLGEQDTRGTLFHDIIRICEAKRPKHVLLENVKGLKTSRHGQTLQTIIKSLVKLGYDVAVELLNSKDYGIPQNRERIWIYGYQGLLPLGFTLAPPREVLKIKFPELMDTSPEARLFKSEEQIKRLIELYGVDFRVNHSACVDLYNRKVRTDGLSITILEPHHNKMRIVHPPKRGKLQVRNYSVEEHYRLMGFQDGEINFCGQSYQQLCKRAANGWDINITSKIFSNIFSQVGI